MDAILQTIRQKLSRGENLSINDFNSLEQIHVNNVMTYSNGNNNDNNNDDDDNDDGSSNNVIEYLDRSLILHDDQQAAAAAAVAAVAVAVDGKDITTCTHLQPRLVRYVGMVQDMLDPEYYESSDKYGRSTHFVDHCDLLNNNNNNEDNDEDNENDNDNENQKCWAERIPLVVVPIPFASKWLMGSCSDNNKKILKTNIDSKSVSAVVSPVSSSNNRAGDRKRGRDNNSNNDDQDSTMKEDNDDDTDEGKNTNSSTTTDHHHQPSNNKKTMTSSTSEEKDNNINNLTTTTTDWWPAGTCGTSIDQCPVLAKICYDQLLSSLSSKQQQQQKQKQRPLKLNDVVSLVGVLSMNPWEADFSAQSCSTTRVADDEIGICGFEVDSHNEYYVPPPSRLPRLHVLSYKQFDLDDLAKQAIDVANKKKSRNSNNNNNRMDGDDDEICTTNSNNNRNNDDDNIEQRSCSMEEEEEELEIIDGRGGGRGTIERISSLLALDPLSSSLSSTALWTRALYLSLLSDADRQHPQNNPGGDDDVEALPATMVRVGPAERALGCVSLRLSTPDVTSSEVLFRQLAEDILPEICPVVAVVDLATTMMNNNDFSLFPRKDSQGRLKPCPLQLPKGSVVLIHYPLSTKKKNENNQDDAQRETILRDLVQHHRLPYQFEGGVVIPFEADYRIIVVTTQTHELPCTLSVLATTGIGMSSTSSATTTGTETIPSKPELREILMKGRLGNGSTGNDELKKFSSSFLQRAQKDFLERRQRFHQTSSSALPGEDDFHRWLSLTRLHTKSRRSIDGLSPNGGEAMMVEEIEGPSLSSFSAPLPSEEYWEPTVEDWEAALQLDDAICDMA